MTHYVKKLISFVAFTILFCFKTIYAQHQRCTDAHNLIDNTPISVSAVKWNAAYPAQRVGCFQDTLHQPYWFKFTALTSGTFEFSLAPKGTAADYDFVLFSDFCPCDTSSKSVVACNWLGWVTQLFGSTGIATNPYQTFNVTDTIAWQEYEKTIQVKAGTNYYLLVDNITNNGVGFDIQFAGTAKIGKALPDPIFAISDIEGKKTVCQNEIANYAIKSNFTAAAKYEWLVPNDAKIIGANAEKSINIQWGKSGGKIGVIASQACQKDTFYIDIATNIAPDLQYADKYYYCKKTCFETKNIKIEDKNKTNGLVIDTYNSEEDAWLGTLAKKTGDYICKPQTFWIRGTNDVGCYDTLQIKLTEAENPSVVLLGGGVYCPGDSAVLSFSFTGVAPYQVKYTDGKQDYNFTTNNNIYTIKIRVDGDITYKVRSFQEKSNLCISNIIGEANFYTPVNCTCLKRAGSMNPYPIDACANTFAVGKHNNDHQAGANDILGFILHSTPKPELGTVYDHSKTAQFMFKDGLMYERTYYISSVLGTKNANGDINLTDPCLGISAGVPIIFHQVPSAKILGDSIICKNEQANLEILPEGKSPFFIDFEANSNKNNINTIGKIAVNGTPVGTYLIAQIEDGNSCINKNVDTLIVANNVPLSVINKKTQCENGGSTFTVSFDVKGGTPNTYVVKGQKGNFNKNNFKSEPLNAGQPYVFVLKDANLCDSVIITGIVDCSCTQKSNPGTMNDLPITICSSLSATASYLNDAQLVNNHILGFVLQDSLGNVLAYNKNLPNFKLEFGMKENYTYFIMAVTGVNDGTGKVNLTNPCTAFSNATTITFVQEPSINFTVDSISTCQNTTIDIPIKTSGFAPFVVEFSNSNGIIAKQIGKNDFQFAYLATKSETLTLKSIKSGTSPGCAGKIGIPNTLKITTITPITYKNLQTKCSNDKQSYTVSFEVEGGEPSFLIDNVLTSNRNYISNSFADGTSYKIELSTKVNCPKTYVQGKVYCSCPPDVTVNHIITNPILCHGDADGAIAVATNMPTPYQTLWSNGAATTSISNLKAGTYTVNVSNTAGCNIIDTILLASPAPLQASINTTNPICFGEKTGEIIIDNIDGGTSPYSFNLDNRLPSNISHFKKLKANDYTVIVTDNNGCTWEKAVKLIDPEAFTVQLNGAKSINLGEEATLSIVTNQPYETLSWNTPTLRKNIETVKPLNTTLYTITVTNEDGCTASDNATIIVDKKRKVYAPNIFSPNGDGVNDYFAILYGLDVLKIQNFNIFDRWGNQILYINEINDEQNGWDGKIKEDDAPEGAYLFKADVLYLDGDKETITGDIQLVR